MGEYRPTELITDIEELAKLRAKNNPDNLPTGHFTGRCMNCGSDDLWDDATAYGCNCCGSLYPSANIAPRKIENGTGRDLGPAW
jgi:hypothetical protein